MREILFRGKRKTNNTWVYGGYIKDITENEIHIGDTRLFSTVYPETFGQYTGLKDKNGTKIFEGDIIRMHYFFQNYDPSTLGAFEDEVNIVGVVKCELLDGFYVETLDDNSIGYLQWVQEPSEELEILGNIYDNPELVKERSNEQ